jgi:hypothetical protein
MSIGPGYIWHKNMEISERSLLKTIRKSGMLWPPTSFKNTAKKSVGSIGCTRFIRYNGRKAEDTFCTKMWYKKTCKPIICTEI